MSRNLTFINLNVAGLHHEVSFEGATKLRRLCLRVRHSRSTVKLRDVPQTVKEMSFHQVMIDPTTVESFPTSLTRLDFESYSIGCNNTIFEAYQIHDLLMWDANQDAVENGRLRELRLIHVPPSQTTSRMFEYILFKQGCTNLQDIRLLDVGEDELDLLSRLPHLHTLRVSHMSLFDYKKYTVESSSPCLSRPIVFPSLTHLDMQLDRISKRIIDRSNIKLLDMRMLEQMMPFLEHLDLDCGNLHPRNLPTTLTSLTIMTYEDILYCEPIGELTRLRKLQMFTEVADDFRPLSKLVHLMSWEVNLYAIPDIHQHIPTLTKLVTLYLHQPWTSKTLLLSRLFPHATILGNEEEEEDDEEDNKHCVQHSGTMDDR